MAASECPSPSSRLFMVDQISKLVFLIDSGSDLCCFPRKLVRNKCSASTFDLCAANNSTIKTYGILTLEFDLSLRRKFHWQFIIADVDSPIIGADFLSHFHLLPDCRLNRLIDITSGFFSKGYARTTSQLSIKSVNISSPYAKLLAEFPELTGLPGLPRIIKHETVHHIRTTPGPPVCSRPRRLNPEKLNIARKEFNDMILAGTARPSDSNWSSPLHLAPKGDHDWRPCGDFRSLNARTIPDCYPVRHIHDFTHNLQGCKIFSVIDLVKAYQQIPVHKSDICKTAITTPFGLFEFPFMTFGLRNAAQTFQRFIDEVLRGLDFCYSYIDDILVFSKSPEEHENHLRTIFQRLSHYGLVINPSKCTFGIPEVKFLGYMVSPSGIKPPIERIKFIQTFPLPKTARGLRRFLGMFDFYRRCIPHASELQAPLHDAISKPLLKGAQLVPWTATLEAAFNSCKEALSSATLLAHPKTDSTLGLFTDASSQSVGACLQQLVDGTWQPLAFFSKKMCSREQSWPAYYRELLAIYQSIHHFRHILEGHSFTIFTDHKPLTYAFKQKPDKLPPKQIDQLSFIAEFSTDIQYIKGPDNVVADALSRIESVSNIFDYEALYTSQQSDPEVQRYLDEDSSLKLALSPVPGSSTSIYCDFSTGKPRPFLTKAFRQIVFQKLHNLSHPGTNATVKLIGDRFVWPSMNKDCRLWARSCIPCQKSKVTRHVHSPVGSFPLPSHRFSHVHVDIVTFPVSHTYRYCLTVVDRFTRWPEVWPMKCITASSVIQAFSSCWISRFGCPRDLTCDRGSQFTSHSFKKFAASFGIKLHYTTSWHPAANGLVERFHRQLKASIKAYSSNDWIDVLPFVLLGIRSSFREDLSATTSELVYGEPLRLPYEFLSTSSDTSQFDQNVFLSQLRCHVSHLRPTPTSRHSRPSVFIFKQLSDCSHVFVREGSILKPLQPPYTGPFEVLRRDDKTFTLNVHNQPVTVSIDRIKPAFILKDDPALQPSTSALSPAPYLDFPRSSTVKKVHFLLKPTLLPGGVV